MKKYFYLSTICLLVLLMSSNVFALPTVNLYVDSSPNMHGAAAAFDNWKESSYASIIDGTFVNMANGINHANIGTTDFEIQDIAAYSFGDYGRLLGWIYQIEGETATSLLGTGRVSISLNTHWDIGWDIPFATPHEPTSYREYDSDGDGEVDGVLAYAAYGYVAGNTQTEVDQFYADYAPYGEHVTFAVTLDNETTTLVANRAPVPAPVPEPSTILLMGIGLLGLVGYSRKRKKS